MAPKASKTEDQYPILKLVMEKGPLSGRIMDFEPRSIIRVGRIIRGNTVAIKDAGISSKHLLIQPEPSSGRRWTITDIGSSNGTSLNGSQLESSMAPVLSDGDVIKIGETTAIRVRFEVGVGECKRENVGRNLRRRGKNGRVELGVIDENSELGHGGNGRKNRFHLRNRCVIEEDEVLGNYNGSLVAENEGKVDGRRTRGSKARELGNAVEEVGVVEISSKASLRRSRASRKEENLENLEIKINKNEGKSNNVDDVNGIDSGREDCAGTFETKEHPSVKHPSITDEWVVDLEKMTLGEWLEFLEMYMPKQIIQVTEEMITGMKQKEEKLHEFLLHQKNSKAVDKVVAR